MGRALLPVSALIETAVTAISSTSETTMKHIIIIILTLLLASLSALHAADDAIADTARHAKLTGLLHNEDCTDFFDYQDCQLEKPARQWTVMWTYWPAPGSAS